MRSFLTFISMLMFNYCMGQYCNEINSIINFDSINNSYRQNFFSNLHQDTILKGTCKAIKFNNQEINYKLIYDHKKKVCVGYFERSTETHLSDTMAFILILGNIDSLKTDTIFYEQGSFIYGIDLSSQLFKLTNNKSKLFRSCLSYKKYFVFKTQPKESNHKPGNYMGWYVSFSTDKAPYTKRMAKITEK